MKQKTKQLIILLGVLLLLVAGWLCVSLLTAEDSTDADESVSGMTYQVANVDQQTVTEISYTLNGQTYTYALKDDATGWLWNEDPTLPLDNLYFANMVTAFTALTSTVRLTDITPTELMDYGLGEDALKIGFTDAAGARVYRIGKYNTYNGLCYFCDERDMTAIYMVACTVGDSFRFTPYQMIALPTLPTDITPAKIMTVTLTPPAGSAAQPSVYTYYVGGKVEGETDVWYGAVGSAEEARLSTEDGKALSTALTTMAFSELVSYRAEDHATFGLDNPWTMTIDYKVTQGFEDSQTGAVTKVDVNRSFTLLLGNVGNKGLCYATVDGSPLTCLLMGDIFPKLQNGALLKSE